MNLFKKLFFIPFLFIFYFNVYSIDYYICLGSFLDKDNAIEYSVNLSEVGISTVHEKTRINNKYFTRVLLSTKYKNLKDAFNKLNELMSNEVIKKANINDLWVRPGKLSNAQKITKSELSSNKKDNKKENQISDDKIAKNKQESSKEKSVPEKKSNEKKAIEELEEKKEPEEKPVNNTIEQKKEDVTTVEENKFRIIDKEGYANCIFANEAIEFGNETNYKLKTTFSKPEKVFARCYFPKNIGKLKSKDFWHEIWINGKFVRKTVFNTPPDPNWDQIQIWITEDDYNDIIKDLIKGEYKITIWVLKNEEIIENDKIIIKTVKLSKGEFTYIVP